MANDVAAVIDNIQKVFGEGSKKENSSNILTVLFDFLSKNDPEIATIQKDFKRKHLMPMLKTWERFSKDVDKNTSKTSEIFEKMDQLFSSLKEKSLNILPNNKQQSNNLEVLKDSYSRNPSFQNETKEDNNLKQPYENEKLIEENKKETIISFSTQTNEFLSNIVSKIIKGQKENLEELNLQVKDRRGGGLMDTIMELGKLGKALPMLFAAIGGASALAGMFWPEIKKFINEKFGDKAAEVFDKFQGTINAIGKFISIGGLQMTVGKTFKTLGDMLGNVADNFGKKATDLFGQMFDNLLGISVKTGFNTTGAAIGAGLRGTLASGAKIMFKGLSKTALKAIPLIGSVISFSDAWGRFKEGEYAQGLIDVGAGLAGFVPGVGTAISVGLSVMNALIDFKGEEEKEKLTQQTLNISSILMKSVGFFSKFLGKGVLSKLPFIGSLFSFGNAWDKFQQNNILGGTLDTISGIAALVPGVGLPLSIGIDILSSFIGTQEAKESGVQRTGFDILKIATKAVSYFAKFGMPFLKKLPFIGSLFNFGSAWDNFKNDNIMAGSLDIAAGIASLFPGVGTAISIGVDVLNSFMSSKTETGKTKFQAVGDWFSKVWNWIKNTKVFKAFSDLFEGVKAVFSGDFKTAMKYLENVPVLGEVIGFFSKDENVLSQTEKKSLEQNKESLKRLPIKYDVEEEQKKSEELQNIEKQNKNLQNELDSLNSKENTPTNRSDANTRNSKISEIKKKQEELLKLQKETEEQLQRYNELKEGKEFHADDFSTDKSFLPQKEKEFSYQPSTNKNFKSGKMIFLNEQDHLMSLKKDGPIDKTFESLNSNIQNLTQKMSNIADEIKMLASKQENDKSSQPVIVNNNSTPSPMPNFQSSNSVDEIYMNRLDYIRNNPYNRPILR
jgi:hypothetical protein